jgi:hypothetical protein
MAKTTALGVIFGFLNAPIVAVGREDRGDGAVRIRGAVEISGYEVAGHGFEHDVLNRVTIMGAATVHDRIERSALRPRSEIERVLHFRAHVLAVGVP